MPQRRRKVYANILRATVVAVFIAMAVSYSGGLSKQLVAFLVFGFGWFAFAFVWIRVYAYTIFKKRTVNVGGRVGLARSILSGVLLLASTYVFVTHTFLTAGDGGLIVRADWIQIAAVTGSMFAFGLVPLMYDLFAHGIFGMFVYVFVASFLFALVGVFDMGTMLPLYAQLSTIFQQFLLVLFPAELCSKLMKFLHIRALEERGLL